MHKSNSVMPGHDTEGVIFEQPDVLSKYTCPECNSLLHDAVQPSCGHWLCQNCADVIVQRDRAPCCPGKSCGEPFTAEEDESKLYFPDRFVRKDILSLSISCKFCNNGCKWSGKIGGLAEHLKKCDYSSTQCKLCHKSLRYGELEAHAFICPCAEKRCPLSAMGCKSNKPMSDKDLNEHLDFNKSQHMELVVDKLFTLERMVQSSRSEQHVKLDSGIGSGIDTSGSGIGNFGSGIRTLGSGIGTLGSGIGTLGSESCDVVEKDCATPTQKKSNFTATVSNSHAPYSPENVAATKIPTIFSEEVAKIRNEMKNSIMKELKFKDEEISSLKTTVQKLERSIRSRNADFEDRDFRLSLIENSNYDGTMVWKIPQFSQRMSDAQSGKYTSIFSLPFYTGRYGFKMCLRLYILGDGIGKGNHMSLFFVLMKGEFDNILQWPFSHKVTFKLINQGTGKDVVDTFQPDPMSTSFRKPRSDMNIASGCPRFVSHDELKTGGFIVDDTVFIKCFIDTATIKHP